MKRIPVTTKDIPMNVKCDCGESRKNHPGDGCCILNACTWFHPNIKYIRKFQKRAEVKQH
jgi:hypothetical protein